MTVAQDEAAAPLEPRLEDGTNELRAMCGALQLHAARTAARPAETGTPGARYWDIADAAARRADRLDDRDREANRDRSVL
jgi:hypothetical protein